MPLPGPPPLKPHALRWRWYIAAYSVSGVRGSITRSVAPVLSSTNSDFVHVAPPSVVLNTPRSALGPQRWPTAATYTMSGFSGWITTRPTCRVARKPIARQVRPASVDLYTPSPHEELWRLLASPVPAQTTFGFVGATARAPMDIIASTRSKTADHDLPWLVLLNTPPLAAATEIASG